MKVKDLINKLREFDDNTEVYLNAYRYVTDEFTFDKYEVGYKEYALDLCIDLKNEWEDLEKTKAKYDKLYWFIRGDSGALDD